MVPPSSLLKLRSLGITLSYANDYFKAFFDIFNARDNTKMHSRATVRGISRRELLMGAATVPLLGNLFSQPAFAEQVRRIPPYEALRKFIVPGQDEFVDEPQALAIESALNQALTGDLPLGANCIGKSPFPGSYQALAPDLEIANFNANVLNIREGWSRWVASLGHIQRADFQALPDSLIRFEITSQREGKRQHRVGLWKQHWDGGKLVEFQPVQEEVAWCPAGKTFFRDVTPDASCFREQLKFGIPYWRSRLDPACGIDIYGSNGIAAGDIDGDGIDEIYVSQPGGLPNRLLKFDAHGNVIDITEQWRAGILDETSMALFLDLRNIGRQDLVVLRSGGPVLLLNDGKTFRLRDDAFRFATRPAGGFTGMSAADFDRDGKLDLYLCCYVYFQSEAQYTYASPYHDAQNGPPNFLFRNNLATDGSGYFDDCTAETGMDENNNRFSFAASWCDFNDDGRPDLYVANDFGRKNLYVNKNGHFRDLAKEAGVEDIGPGMSASWFDYDNDGKPDLYVANMWTAAGQRVIEDDRFLPAHAGGSASEAYRRHTMGNSLFRNRGDGTFEDVSREQNVGFGRWAWASGGHDFDNDGQAEIFGTCGMLTNQSTTDLSGFFWRQVVARSPVTAKPSAEYENGWNAINQFIREDFSWNGREPNVFHVRRGGRYYDFSGVSGLDFAEDSRAYAVTDFDGDGQPDIVLKSRLGPQVRMLQNNCATSNQAIAFLLRGTKSNRDAIGARVEVDGQVKWLEAGSGFLSQHSKRMIFGLHDAASVKRVSVKWPSGAVQEFAGLAAGNTYTITEGGANAEPKPFAAHRDWPSGDVRGVNDLRFEDTWFLEPVPLPETRSDAKLVVLLDGQPAPTYAAKIIDFAKEAPDRRRIYEVFRRYLFDWRAPLVTPVAFLMNDSGHAVKVYAKLPSEQQVQADLAISRPSALPFSGNYVKQPRRDFFKFGAAFLWSGYSEQALPYLQKVLEQSPENPRVLVLVAQIHQQAGRQEEAEKSFRAALAVHPNYAEAWSGLGDVSDARNDLREAVANYKKALALKPDLFYTLLNAAQTADKLDDQKQAETWTREAVRINPQSPDALNGLGLALAKQNQPDEAKKYFEQAISIRRDYGDAINNLGVLYLQQGKTNDAIAAFEFGIREAPDEDILYLNLGRTYTRQQDYDRARAVMQKLLDRKPRNATALKALADLDRAVKR
jgi:tetratricopeptide (TPR) repeat protein